MTERAITPEIVREAAEDEEAFERLLTEYRRHIRYRVYRTTHRVVTEDDDEWSVAVLAFWEAVKSFDESKGNFTAFADTVIVRRVIDHIRENVRRDQEISVDIDTALSDIESGDSVEDERKFEVEALTEELSRYGIRFTDLIRCSPKSEKTRRACAEAVSLLLDSDDLLSEMKSAGELPIKKISESSGVPRKTIERHRRYIIAAAIVLNGYYPALSGYMTYIAAVRKGMKKNESHSS